RSRAARRRESAASHNFARPSGRHLRARGRHAHRPPSSCCAVIAAPAADVALIATNHQALSRPSLVADAAVCALSALVKDACRTPQNLVVTVFADAPSSSSSRTRSLAAMSVDHHRCGHRRRVVAMICARDQY
ncbi:hypothetical protein Dimus_017778, partial [Dionaea muscipula]